MPTATTNKAKSAKSLTVTKKPGTERDVIAEWKWSTGGTEGFEYQWGYYTTKATRLKPKGWVVGTYGTVDKEAARVGGPGSTVFTHEWTAPDEAEAVYCRIRPVSETYKVKEGKETVDKTYFTAVWTGLVKHYFASDKPAAPTVDVEMDGTYAKVTVHSDDPDRDNFDVEVYEGKKRISNYCIKARACNASGDYVFHFKGNRKVPAGKTYRFRARVRAKFNKKHKSVSNWSAFVDGKSVPAKPGKPSAKAATKPAAIVVRWPTVSGAVSYEIAYVADIASFNSDTAQTVSDIQSTAYRFIELEAGHTWFFRVRAINESGEGPWSSYTSAIFATRPSAPTVYDTDPVYIIGQTVRLRWTHNAEDGSDQEQFSVGLYRGDGSHTQIKMESSNQYYDLDTSNFSDGERITWCIATKGAWESGSATTTSFSPVSETHSFRVYIQPSLVCTLETEEVDGKEEQYVTSLPIKGELDSSAGGNNPVAYHISISPTRDIEMTDLYGNDYVIQKGEELFSKDYQSTSDPFKFSIGPDEIVLYDSNAYELRATVSMASGLYASDRVSFETSMDHSPVSPNAEVGFERNELCAYIKPICYTTDENGLPTETLASGSVLSVYRIDSDGNLVLLLDNIENDNATEVMDPHAAFGECWYRIVAKDPVNGQFECADVSCASPYRTCVIQWDEAYSREVEDADIDGTAFEYVGMRIGGLYNMNFNENGDVESEDVEYVGRKYPVSYYGTQLGYTARYQLEFPRSDVSTLAACRRLMAYRGDVYIREPSGTGFWAHAKCGLSYSYDLDKATLSIDATRVDHEDQPMMVGGQDA